jgi:hypothetical protein
MIKDSTLNEAIAEAQRFINAAQTLQQTRKQPPIVTSWGEYPPAEVREHASCKRASMDLTRKLADLRAGR